MMQKSTGKYMLKRILTLDNALLLWYISPVEKNNFFIGSYIVSEDHQHYYRGGKANTVRKVLLSILLPVGGRKLREINRAGKSYPRKVT